MMLLDWKAEWHLREEFAAILDEYIPNPDDIGFVVLELIDALKQELAQWPNSTTSS